MAIVVKDRVKVSSTIIGTGTATLGAAATGDWRPAHANGTAGKEFVSEKMGSRFMTSPEVDN